MLRNEPVIQFAFANDSEGKLVPIRFAVPGTIYTCPGCQTSMVPVLGHQTIHYRHLKAFCSYESYLHRTSKLAMFQRLSNQTVVPLILKRTALCQSAKSKILDGCAIPCQLLIPAMYNLRVLFDEVVLEGYDSATGLKPDVLLANRSTGAKCYIEIHVTHACTPEKIASEVPILEFFIKSEADIEALINDDLRVDQEFIKAYNFKPASLQLDECHPQCHHSELVITTWQVSAKGRLQKNDAPFSDYPHNEPLAGNVWPENLPTKTQLRRLKDLTTQASVQMPVRTCINCISALDWAGGLVECEMKHSFVDYTEARICSAYRFNHE